MTATLQKADCSRYENFWKVMVAGDDAASWASLGSTVVGGGGRTNVLVNLDTATKFLRLVQSP